MHDSPPSSAAAAEPQFHALPRRSLILTVIGLMLSLLLAALDQTIVGTAMPRIVSELHGFEHYAWVTTAYLLTSTTVVPIAGKLSDLYGRKVFLLGGAIFFVATSALCGIAQDMTQLIVFRGLQGIGGGVLMATVFTVISQIFPPAERGKIQGAFGAVFGLSSIVGPVLGGFLTDNLDWRWVFYVNVPVGALAVAVLFTSFPNVRGAKRKNPIDFLGAAALIAAVVPLLLGLSFGGTTGWEWNSAQTLGLFAFGILMTGVFLFVESRAAEPIIPLSLFQNQIVTVSIIAMMLMATGMFGTILFIPLFIQGVIGSSATQSGTVLTPMMVAMITASMVSGQIISRTGRYKLVGLVGLSVMTLGLFLLSTMDADTDYFTVVRNMVIVGLGMGPTMPVFTLAAQNSVGMSQLGVVTSLTQFARSIGSTLGVAVFGSLLNNRFSPAFLDALPETAKQVIPAQQLQALQSPTVLLNPAAATQMKAAFAQFGPQGAQLYDMVFGAIKTGLVLSLHDLFLVGAGLVGLGVVAVIFLKEIPLKKGYGEHAAKPEEILTEDAVPSMAPVRDQGEPTLAGARR